MKQSYRLFVLFFVFVAGCAPFASRMAIEPTETSSDRVIQIIEKNHRSLHNLKGKGRILVEAPGRSYALDAQVVVQRPDTLFIRLEALFGVNVGWLFSDRQRFTFYIPMQNSYFTGATDSLTTSPLLDFEIPYQHLLNTLTGTAMIGELQDPQWRKETKEWILSGRTRLGNQFYWIDLQRGVIKRAELRDSTGQAIVVELFERYDRVHGIYIPRTIRLQRPLTQQGLTLFYETMAINQKSVAKELKRKIPQNARRMEL